MNYKVISCIIITIVALFNAFTEYLDWKSMKNRMAYGEDSRTVYRLWF